MTKPNPYPIPIYLGVCGVYAGGIYVMVGGGGGICPDGVMDQGRYLHVQGLWMSVSKI